MLSNILNGLSYGGIVAIVGLFIVFLGLVILILCITVMGKVFEFVTKPKAEPAPQLTPPPAPVPVPVITPVSEPEAPAGIDPQVIAVIAAALAAYDGSNKRLVVRKVRRVSAWNNTARREQVDRF